MNKRALFAAMRHAGEHGMKVSVNSSLVPLTAVDAHAMKSLDVMQVLVSVMGPTADAHDSIAQRTGSFQRTVSGIHLLKAVGIPLVVNMVLTQRNRHLIRETAQTVRQLGVRTFCCTRACCPANCTDFTDLALTRTELREYLDELVSVGEELGLRTDVLNSYPHCGMKDLDRYRTFSKRRCLAGVTTMTVGSNGEARPCSHVAHSYGNVLTEELSVIWARMNVWRDGSLLPATCTSCPLVKRCGGGCRMEAKTRSGSLLELDPFASPDDVPACMEILQQRHETVHEDIGLPVAFSRNPAARHRREDFGGIVTLSGQSTAFLNHQGYDYVQQFQTGRVYLMDEIVESGNAKLQRFLRGLLRLRVFLPAEGVNSNGFGSYDQRSGV